MSQSELDQFINQLSDEDVKVRRDAAKRLGDLAQPEAIPELANTYEKDEDEGVRKAAAEALRKFRRLELQSQNSAGESGAGSSSANPLGRVRAVLLIVLVVTILANIVIAAPKLIAGFAPAAPTQSLPTERSVIIDGLSNRITAVKDIAALLQKGFRGLQGMGAEALIVNKPICDQLKTNEVSQVHLSELDARTYPDLPGISDQINLAALQATSLRASYLLICDTKMSAADLTKQLETLGGVAKLVSDADAITNQFLGDANNQLQHAKDQPAPTVGPTFTPTYTATATPVIPTTQPPPTSTPLGATAAPVSANATGAIPPTQGAQAATAAVTATITPTATVTPLAAITFDGFHLDKLTSFQSRLSIQADGAYLNGQTFSSSMQLTVMQQNSPMQARYDIYGTDVNLSKGGPRLFGNTGLAGSTTLTILNNTLYVDGDMARSISPQAQRCIVLPYTGNETRVPKLDLTDFPSLQNLSLVTVPLKPGEGTVNGVKVKHFHAEQTGAQLKTVVDLYVTDDDKQLPVQLKATIETVDQPATQASTPGPYQKYTISIEYNLMEQNPTVNVSKPTGCTAAQSQPTARPTAKPKATIKK